MYETSPARDSEIVTIPYEEAYGGGFEDMYRRVPDTAKIEQAIGWERVRDLDEILRDVLASTSLAVAAERECRAGLPDRRRNVIPVGVERRAGSADRRLTAGQSDAAATVAAHP